MTAKLGGVLKMLDPVLGLNPLNDFWQSICASERQPFLLGLHHQSKEHSEGGCAAEAPLCLSGSVRYGGEDTFDRVGGSDVLPVLGREVVERQ